MAGLQHSAIKPRFRIGDFCGAHLASIEIGRGSAADDCVGVTVGGHVGKRGEKECASDSLVPDRLGYAGRAKKPACGRVVNREPEDLLLVSRDETGKGLTRESNFAFAR